MIRFPEKKKNNAPDSSGIWIADLFLDILTIKFYYVAWIPDSLELIIQS
jgi:hypothetical protein